MKNDPPQIYTQKIRWSEKVMRLRVFTQGCLIICCESKLDRQVPDISWLWNPHPLTYMHCSCSRFRSKLNVSIYKSTCCILLYNHEGIQNEPQICPVESSCISRANVPCTFWGPRPGNQDVSLSPSTQVVPPLPLPLHSYSKTLVLAVVKLMVSSSAICSYHFQVKCSSHLSVFPVKTLEFPGILRIPWW